MKTRTQSILGLVLAFLIMLVWVPSPVRAESYVLPLEELEAEVTWQITASSNRSWRSQDIGKDDKVCAQYDGNDSFSLNLAGTTALTNTSGTWNQTPYFKSLSNNKDYSRSCQGDGNQTSQFFYDDGSQRTSVENWHYSWPATEHEGADNSPIQELKLILPQSENEPLRYEIYWNPFFFIDYDSPDDYFDTTSDTYGDVSGHHNGPSLAYQAWYDWGETHPDGGGGELTFSAGQFRDKDMIHHPFRVEESRPNEQNCGQSFIEINYEINLKPWIKDIQPNQVLGRYEYKNDLDYTPATDFVAGKDTVIQVFLSKGLKAEEQAKALLKIYHNGTNVATLTNFKKDKPNNALIFIPPSRSTCGNWKAGTYKFVAQVGDSKEFEKDNVIFEERGKLKVYAVPVKANYAGEIKIPGNQWKRGANFMRRVYPIAYNDFTYKLRGEPYDASDPSFDLTTDAGQEKLWEHLNALQGNEGSYDLVIGFIEEGIPLPNNKVLQGYTYGEPSSIVVNSDEDMPATVAHEVAHIYDVGDEYFRGSYHLSVNSPPFGYYGWDWDNEHKLVTASDPTVKPFPGAAGSLISEKLHPYDTGGRGLLKDSMSFMGSGAAQSKNWISPSVWQHLFESLTPPVAATAIMAFTGTGGTRVIEASGWVSNTGEVELSLPWTSYTTTKTVVNSPGTYTIQAVDENDKVLASNGFNLSFLMRSNPPLEIDSAPFTQVIVPFPEGTKKFWVMDQNDTLLKELGVSSGVPTVTITAPAAGNEITGTATITWTAEDPDADSLYYQVEYTPDGTDWIILACRLTDTKWVQDFSKLPGGDRAQIQVTASDGINSATATSDLRVPLKGPEVFIEEPEAEASYAQDEGVVLYGSAYDPQEGQVYDDNRLIWTSDRAGELGCGPTVFATNLEVGRHEITLTATNNAGISGTESITLYITPVEEPGTVTELPSKTFADPSKRKVIFNKPINAATLQNQIRVEDVYNNPVPIEVLPGDDGISAIIYPLSGTFQTGQTYTIYIDRGIQSASGQPLKCGYKMSFRVN
ncbi:MAG: Ig-like domain-containing protein [Syntrophomonadaceae bacterium]|nr:Ig-like domain-containing protein [Syntrophomonadaceae bacterium]